MLSVRGGWEEGRGLGESTSQDSQFGISGSSAHPHGTSNPNRVCYQMTLHNCTIFLPWKPCMGADMELCRLPRRRIHGSWFEVAERPLGVRARIISKRHLGIEVREALAAPCL